MADNGGTVRTKRQEFVARPATLPYAPKPAPVRQHTRPFFRDPAHTRPTRWGLYRQLLRAMGGAAALAARTAAASSSRSTPSSSSSLSSSSDSAEATALPTIPASRVLRGSSYLAAFQGTEHVKARKMPVVQAYDGFAPFPPLRLLPASPVLAAGALAYRARLDFSA
ncbi:hypothetical protein CspeluHIS016_0800080 [Cutaneotrichosporon spelunceum]|uniref:Uncharacterized protein n=1 Tax=Cutaneotrichosporon spelunceum TaxID=1672016 RepID=A0AAD3TYV2_9TREE|nr:hypothetical protein CspeluHIS016_0800080 [Cutaneotrichosporon spelunceum]